MLRVKVTADELTSQNLKISGAGDDVVLTSAQMRSFEVPDDGTITISAAEPVDPTIRDGEGKPATDISEGNHNNPNGIMTAGIAPKMPKPGGETEVVPTPEGAIERTLDVDPAKARSAGGPETDIPKESATPGPKPNDLQTAAARSGGDPEAHADTSGRATKKK